MRADEAENVLLGLLSERGQKPDALDARPAWEVFRDFMRRPVADARDGLMYEYLTTRVAERRVFVLSFCRQFQGDGDSLLQVGCELTYEAAPDLAALGTGLVEWWQEEGTELETVLSSIDDGDEWPVLASRRPVTTEVCAADPC
ncbi:hypothetical protein [Spirillospora albida]|uniref:hypothetical protein n=1 Tax=Spirillospora albida TaxID=58123 RepID=UPI0004C1E7B9|nr:hypothetical protein [Spirillospora albida]